MGQFVEFLIETPLQKKNKETIVSLVAETRRIMKGLDMANGMDLEDPRSYSFFDLIEALDIVKEVVVSRAKEPSNQYTNDHENGHSQLFDSIQEEVKEAVKAYFYVPGQKSTRFIHLFNSLIVEKIIDALREGGIENVAPLARRICAQGRESILSVTSNTTDITFREAQFLLRKYQKERAAVLKGKHTTDGFDRIEINKALQHSLNPID